MPTKKQVDLLATAQNRVASLAVSELQAAWAKTGNVNDPAALRDLLVEMMPSITRRYGVIAATAAAQWYDAVRATEVQADGFKAQADTQDDAADAAAGSARWAATPLFDGMDGAARAAAVDRAGEAVDRLVRESGRMTLESNARRDPAAKRWMIVPQGVTCAWCAMLASRGAAYLSEGSAARSVHAHCDCQVVPDFGSGVQGYSAKPYRDLYDRARAEAGEDASSAEVLAAMRRLPGTALSDGVGGKPPHGKSGRKRFGDDWDGGIIKPSEAELEELGKRVNGKYTVKQKNSALNSWTGSYFQVLQDKIYKGGKLDIGARMTMAELDEALTDHTTSEMFTVDRYGDPRIFGVRDPHDIDKLRNGRITKANAGYLATSLDAGGHGVGVRPGEGVRIRILLPPGTHCAYLQNVTQVKEEHEILLPRGVKLKVIRHGIDKDYERYVHAVLVSDGQS